MNKKEIILPWKKPIINIVPETDIVFSLAANNPDTCLPFIIENFINIRYKTNFVTSTFAAFVGDHSEWYRYKFLSVQTVPHWLIDFNSLESFIYKALNQGNYILCNINTKFIHNYINFARSDYRHCITIYGIRGNDLLVSDYFDYKMRQNCICSIVEFRNALQDFLDALEQNRPHFMPQLKDHLNGILLVKENSNPEKIELSKILFELRNFLHPNNEIQEQQKISYGIGYFELLSNYLKSNDKNHPATNYTKHLQLIYAHTKLMKLRVQFLNENYFGGRAMDINGITQLETSTILMRNNYLRAEMKQENSMQYHRKLSSQIYDFYNKYGEYLSILEYNLETLV